MLDWLTDPNVMEVNDQIEQVNRKMFDKMTTLNENVAVLFGKNEKRFYMVQIGCITNIKYVMWHGVVVSTLGWQTERPKIIFSLRPGCTYFYFLILL